MKGFNLSALAVREGTVTLFLILAIATAGVLALFKLGRAEDPGFTVKVLTVAALWPGATAQEMQDLVADPLEKRLQELRWYDRVETISRPGITYLELSLKDSTPARDVPEEFYQARKKLGDEARNLPTGAVGPFVNDEYSDVDFGIYALEAPKLPMRLLVRQAETIRQRLLQVPGVRKVELLGERPEKIFVEFSYARIATLNISPQDISDAIVQRNAVTPAGSVETRGPQVFIRLDGAYQDLDALRDTPITAGGRNLRLADVAEVRRGYEDPPTFLIRHNGEPALALGVVMRDGWNGLDLGRALEKETAAVARELPLGMSFTKITDQAVNIREAVDEFMLKFGVALAVVLLVSLLSLGWRGGLIVAAAVPLTLAAVFILMLATGKVFDRVTLGALILGLGLLVDDAIIAIEMMVVKMAAGADRVEAAAHAWTVTAAPMLSGTVVTIIGLMPVGFAASSAGEYAGNLFWIVGFALLASWLVAVIFTPYLGVKWLPEVPVLAGGHARLYATPRYERLRRVARWCVHRRWTVTGLVVGAFALSVFGLGVVKKEFFPVSERPEVIVEVRLPKGTSIEVTLAAAIKVEGWLKAQPEARIVTSYIGQGAPRFFLSLDPELPDPSFAKLIVLTPDAGARGRLKQKLRARVARGLAPEADVRVTQLLFGPPVPFPVAFRVMGPDLARLRAIAGDVEQAMRANPHLRRIDHEWGERAPTAHFVLDQNRLRLIGLSPKEAADQLQFYLTGVPLTQVREDIRTVDIVARSTGWQRLDPSRLEDLNLGSRDGHLIPLTQVGRVEIRLEEPYLFRRDRTPTLTVRADIDETLQPEEVTGEVLRTLRPIIAGLPPGYRIETAGSVEEAAKGNAALFAVFPIVGLLMLGVIMLQVRSFRGTVMVLLTAPLGLVGAVPILLIFGQPFGFNAILALIGLAGILMRNTLILVVQIHTNQASGLNTHDAAVEATVQRARPVLLTAVAAVLAFTPLTLSAFWGTLAFTFIGGTAVGTALTLLFLPAQFALWFPVEKTGR